MKILSSLLVISACGFLGLEKARRLAARSRELRLLETALKALETEISYGVTPLPQALQRAGGLAEGMIKEFFSLTGHHLERDPGGGLYRAWERGLKFLKDNSSLTQGDLEILTPLGLVLGLSGVEDQVKHLVLAQRHLSHQARLAAEETAKKARMWYSLGFLLGLALILLLY